MQCHNYRTDCKHVTIRRITISFSVGEIILNRKLIKCEGDAACEHLPEDDLLQHASPLLVIMTDLTAVTLPRSTTHHGQAWLLVCVQL